MVKYCPANVQVSATARQLGLTSAPMIVRDLDDEQMLQFMGRENLEDYNADFLTMLETWESAVDFGNSLPDPSQPLGTAKILGWVRGADGPGVRMNQTALACNAAAGMIAGGYVARTDLDDLTVTQVSNICTRAQANIDRLEKTAKKTNRPAVEVEAAKKHIGKAVTKTAKESRRGEIAQKDLRGQVDVNTYRMATVPDIGARAVEYGWFNGNK